MLTEKGALSQVTLARWDREGWIYLHNTDPPETYLRHTDPSRGGPGGHGGSRRGHDPAGRPLVR